MNSAKQLHIFIWSAVVLATSILGWSQNPQDCSKVPSYEKLKTAMTNAVKQGQGGNGGLGNQEWGAVVNRDGVIGFGGGLPLYTSKGELVGALGASGDTACADHVIAWRARHELGLDGVPMGVAPGSSDNLIFDIQNGQSLSGFGHPTCKGGKP